MESAYGRVWMQRDFERDEITNGLQVEAELPCKMEASFFPKQ